MDWAASVEANCDESTRPCIVLQAANRPRASDEIRILFTANSPMKVVILGGWRAHYLVIGNEPRISSPSIITTDGLIFQIS